MSYIISDDELNLLYGHIGQTFDTREEAERFKQSKKHARLYRLTNGTGEGKVYIGYLVSIEGPTAVKGHFTGKVRVPNA